MKENAMGESKKDIKGLQKCRFLSSETRSITESSAASIFFALKEKRASVIIVLSYIRGRRQMRCAAIAGFSRSVRF